MIPAALHSKFTSLRLNYLNSLDKHTFIPYWGSKDYTERKLQWCVSLFSTLSSVFELRKVSTVMLKAQGSNPSLSSLCQTSLLDRRCCPWLRGTTCPGCLPNLSTNQSENEWMSQRDEGDFCHRGIGMCLECVCHVLSLQSRFTLFCRVREGLLHQQTLNIYMLGRTNWISVVFICGRNLILEHFWCRAGSVVVGLDAFTSK